jgi:SAM-dependent methyltransferase
MPDNYNIFNRRLVKLHRARATASLAGCDFLLREMAGRMADRLPDFRKHFPTALELGAHTGILAPYLGGIAGIKTLVQTDLSEAMIRQAPGLKIVADEEWLPFASQVFDLVVSGGSLHWINDLPGALIQIHRCLKPDGLFLAMLPGGETLKELRQSFEQAELKIKSGISPHVSPFVDVRDAGSLLQRAGFAEPVVDSEILTVHYEDPLFLLQDLRAMGETNALVAANKGFTGRSVLTEALDYYRQHFTADSARVAASFEIVTLTAWKSHVA